MPLPVEPVPVEPLPIQTDLHRARSAVVEAELAERAADRYLAAQQAALRIAAVVLALRNPPVLRAQRSRRDDRRGPRNAWRVVGEVAPELGEWAAFFEATQARADLVRRGVPVAAREADDLVRDAQGFLALVEKLVSRALQARAQATLSKES